MQLEISCIRIFARLSDYHNAGLCK